MELLAISANGTIYATTYGDAECLVEAFVEDCKPYLFPMSSMTEEQRYEISSGLQNIHTEHPPFGKIESSGSDNCLECVTMASTWLIGYYNKNHLDYLGLIPMGLAIDCTNLNIYQNYG